MNMVSIAFLKKARKVVSKGITLQWYTNLNLKSEQYDCSRLYLGTYACNKYTVYVISQMGKYTRIATL